MRGQRLTELLKQDLVSPVDVGTRSSRSTPAPQGFLDELKNSRSRSSRRDSSHIPRQYPDVFEPSRRPTTMTPELEETLKNAYREYTDAFKAKQASARHTGTWRRSSRYGSAYHGEEHPPDHAGDEARRPPRA